MSALSEAAGAGWEAEGEPSEKSPSWGRDNTSLHRSAIEGAVSRVTSVNRDSREKKFHSQFHARGTRLEHRASRRKVKRRGQVGRSGGDLGWAVIHLGSGWTSVCRPAVQAGDWLSGEYSDPDPMGCSCRCCAGV